MCNQGVLGKLLYRESGLPRHRCNLKNCHRFVTPQHLHPFHSNSRPTRAFAAITICGSSAAAVQFAFECGSHLDQDQPQSLGALVAETQEKQIQFGKGGHWQDVEADEATFDKELCGLIAFLEPSAGLVTRGRPESLVLNFNPPPTAARVPGPRAIRKVDWKPIVQKWLQNRNAVPAPTRPRSLVFCVTV